MEKLFELASLLSNLKMYKVTLEVGYNELIEYNESVIEWIKGSGGDKNVLAGTDTLNLFLKIYGVQMLITCRNIGIEPSQT